MEEITICTDADTLDAKSKVDQLTSYINELNPTIKVSIQTTGMPALAQGTKKAKKGPALVDDGVGSNAGPELIEHRSKGTYEIGGDDGPRITHLDAGDVVHTAQETKKILKKRGVVGTRLNLKSSKGLFTGDAFAGGTYGDTIGGIGGGGDTNRKKKKNSKGGSNWQKYVEKLFDWIEVRLTRLQKITDKWLDAVKHAVGYIAKNTQLDMAIKSVQNQIDDTKASIVRYAEELATIQKKMKLSD